MICTMIEVSIYESYLTQSWICWFGDNGIFAIVNIFEGGNGDGFNLNCYSQQSLIPDILFSGGAGDGFNIDCYLQGQVLSFGPFTGGDGDGDEAVVCNVMGRYCARYDNML